MTIKQYKRLNKQDRVYLPNGCGAAWATKVKSINKKNKTLVLFGFEHRRYSYRFILTNMGNNRTLSGYVI